MIVREEEIKSLIKQKQDTIRNIDNQSISEHEGRQVIKSIDEKLNNYHHEMIKQKEEQKMTEEVKVEEQKPKIKAKSGSVATAIAKALSMKTVKNIDEAVVKVKETFPDKEDKKIKAQIKVIIKETEKGKGRWINYTWDKENFLLAEK